MSEILDNYYEAILFMYEDSLLLDFIQKYNIVFERDEIDDTNIFKVKSNELFNYLMESVILYFKDKNSNKGSLIKLKLEEAFLNLLNDDKEFKFRNFLKNIYQKNYFKLIIEKEFDYKENILNMINKMGLTPLSFREKFKNYFYTTPRKWQNKKRLEKAKILLQEGRLNVTEVCIEVGFDNISWFIQSFKKEYGITPKQVKNN